MIHDVQAEAVFSGVQGEGCSGSDPGRADDCRAGKPARRAPQSDRPLEEAGGRKTRPRVQKLARVFDDKAADREAGRAAEIEKLHAKIGELLVERDFLSKASGR